MIIIEGAVGVGKTTLQKRICEKLNNSYMLVQDFEHNICLLLYRPNVIKLSQLKRFHPMV